MRQCQHGFTLVEAIVVMVITGVIAAVVAVFIVKPVEGYLDTAARAEMTDVADTALRRIARDVRLALPRSLRIAVGTDGNVYMELLLTKTGGRYLSANDNPTTGMPLRFDTANCGTTPTDCQFSVVGGLPTGVQQIVANDQIVVYNLGEGYTPLDAYNCTGPCNRATVTAVDLANATLTLASNPFAANNPPMPSPGNRFQVVTTPVTYVCAAGQLIRYWGYPIQATQPTNMAGTPLTAAGTNTAVLASDVAACSFTTNNLATRNGAMVELQINMGSAAARGGAIQLVQQVHVDNTP